MYAIEADDETKEILALCPDPATAVAAARRLGLGRDRVRWLSRTELDDLLSAGWGASDSAPTAWAKRAQASSG